MSDAPRNPRNGTPRGGTTARRRAFQVTTAQMNIGTQVGAFELLVGWARERGLLKGENGNGGSKEDHVIGRRRT